MCGGETVGGIGAGETVDYGNGMKWESCPFVFFFTKMFIGTHHIKQYKSSTFTCSMSIIYNLYSQQAPVSVPIDFLFFLFGSL